MDHFVNDIKTSDPVISDHLAAHSTLCLETPKFVKKVVSSRKLHSIDKTSFRSDIEGSFVIQHQDDIHIHSCERTSYHCPSICAMVYS